MCIFASLLEFWVWPMTQITTLFSVEVVKRLPTTDLDQCHLKTFLKVYGLETNSESTILVLPLGYFMINSGMISRNPYIIT